MLRKGKIKGSICECKRLQKMEMQEKTCILEK